VPAAAPEAAAVLTSAGDDLGLVIVKAPIVGTFYRAPEPGAPSFVDTGQAVRRGQVLCIIEAMKLMNEINAECDGEVSGVRRERAARAVRRAAVRHPPAVTRRLTR
jgi:acetyl-CoA carboxylase biotin carboxyl carrier protein